MPMPGWVAQQQLAAERTCSRDIERQLKNHLDELREVTSAFRCLLDAMDYERGACKPTDMVAAAVPLEILRRARIAAGVK